MTTKHSLYYSKYCFFCQKVLMFLRGKDTHLELRNVSDSVHQSTLIKGGGKGQVPCLLIESDAGVEWMYESNDIIRYLS